MGAAEARAAESAERKSTRPHRWLKRIAVLCALAVLVGLGAVYAAIARQAQVDESRTADVIIVFGAAQYAGHPSPAYRARLDHAVALYQRGLAPVIITTGGAGRDAQFNEGQVGRDYLIARGIPEGRLIAETQGEDTLESAERLAAIMHENGMKSCLAVSDGYHMFRVKRMMAAEGVTAYAAPRPDQHPERWPMVVEVFKFLAWKAHLEWSE